MKLMRHPASSNFPEYIQNINHLYHNKYNYAGILAVSEDKFLYNPQ